MIVQLLLATSLELSCPATRIIQYYQPISNVKRAIVTAKRTCAREGKCLISITEQRPNIFYAICGRPKEP